MTGWRWKLFRASMEGILRRYKRVKLPDGKLLSSGQTCGYCRYPTGEHWVKLDDTHFYRCQKCIDTANPKDKNPCPKCGCKAHGRISGSWTFNEYGFSKCDRDMRNPIRPEIETFECMNCGYRWYTPEYESYLLAKSVKG